MSWLTWSTLFFLGIATQSAHAKHSGSSALNAACDRDETIAHWGDLTVKRARASQEPFGTLTFCRGKIAVRQFRDSNAYHWNIEGIVDLDGDGRAELNSYFYSGGAHCCTTHVIFRRNPMSGRIQASRLEQGNGEQAIFRRIKGYPRPVMLLSDRSSAYMFAAYAWTVAMPYAVEIGSNGFGLARPLMHSTRPGEGPTALRNGPPAWRAFLVTFPPNDETELHNVSPPAERLTNLRARLSAALAAGRPPAEWDGLRLDVERHVKLYCYYDSRCDVNRLIRQVEGGHAGALREFGETLRASMAKSQPIMLRRRPIGWH